MRMNAVVIAVALATAAVSAQEPTVRIHAARVVDGAGKVIQNATVVVQGSKITAVEAGASAGRATYDLGQLTLMPGMIDVHSHLGWHFGHRRTVPAARVVSGAGNSLQRRERLCDADGGVHDDPEPRTGE